MESQWSVLRLMSLIRPSAAACRKVRIGALGDGGYVLPDDLADLRAVISLGIGNDVSFDRVFADRGIPVYQYDPSIPGPPQPHARFHFSQLAWGPADTSEAFSLTGILQRHGLVDSNDLLLKFDTEGAEWTCIPHVSPDVLKHFRVIVCELHGLNQLHDAGNLQTITTSLSVLTQHHTVVHLHANNCCGMSLVAGVPIPAVVELTLLRNDRSHFSRCIDPIPGPLDYPNLTDRPDLVLRPFS